jgi:hypothetical protein
MTPPFGYQSGYTTSPTHNDDTYPSTFLYDAQHNLIYFTGVTYSTFFDKINNLSPNTLGAMGMSMVDPSDEDEYHLTSGDCFIAILKLPQPSSSNNSNNNNNEPRLIYAKRMGTPQNSEACSSMTMLPHNTVTDALLHTSNQLKLVLLGHVNPVPLSLDELEMVREKLGGGGGLAEFDENGYRRRLEGQQQQQQQQKQQHRSLEKQEVNQGGYFTSLSHDNIPNSSGGSGGSSMLGGPLTHNGRAYGFTIDFDLSLTPNEEFDLDPPKQHNTPSSSTSSSSEGSPPLPLDMNNAYGALLGGHVLESSPLVYPIDITYNIRDPNQLYVVSMHSDKEDSVVYNDEYPYSVEEEMNGKLFARPDVTLGGAGGSRGRSSSSSGDDDGSGGLFVGGVPKYGSNFYVKIQQVTITPYEQLLNVQPTPTEHVKQTMKSGWGFGFKLNDASDVRPSCIEFVKGRTPDEDLILLGGTTRKVSSSGGNGVVEEYDGFVTKLVPPSPSPVMDGTSGATVEDAIHGEGTHPTKRIDSTTGRDETVAAICLPPPDAGGMGVTHAFIVGSSTNPNGTSSQAYLLKMKLDDMSTVWKMHVPSISSNGGVGGDVLGQGCAVSHDGKIVYLSGTIDGESGMRTGDPNSDVKPIGGMSDVFVVAYDAEFGNVKWEQQVGTKYEDKLARGGGIQVDNDGNAMIMGSTRGALQRSREDLGRMSSDVFFMSLARENGAHINAPFAGSGSNHSSSVAAVGGTAIPNSGVLTGVVIAAVTMISALLIIVVRRRRRGKAAQKEVSRMWDRRDSDDHSYTNRYTDRPSPKDEIDECGDEDRTSSGALRIVRGGVDDGWDDGTEIINRGVWKRVGSLGSEKSSGSSKGTNSQTYVRKDSEDSASFLAKLREESSERMKGLSGMMNISDATDPRMDDGASIKNLLSQYREVKKGGIISSDGKAGKSSSSGKKTPPKSRPLPPPPPRRNYDGEPDGLSEFTIV